MRLKKHKRGLDHAVNKRGIKENAFVRKIFVTLISMMALVAVILGTTKFFSQKIFLTIDGSNVSEEEYRWAMFSARNDILAQMGADGGSQITWNVQTDFGIPYEMVTERAIQILQEYYAVASLGVECGYLRSVGFGELTENLEEENEKRIAAIADKEFITGLARYNLDQSIQYRMDAIRRQYCEDEGNPGMYVSEADLRQQYEQDKANLYTQADDLDLHYIEIDTGDMNLSGKELVDLEDEVYLLRQEAVNCASLQEALLKFPDLKQYYSTLEISGNEFAVYARSYTTLLGYAESLQTGVISDVINENGTVFLIECAKRMKNDYIPFENLTSVLMRSVRNRRYNCIIQERIAQTKVEYDTEKLYQYTLRQLG